MNIIIKIHDFLSNKEYFRWYLITLLSATGVFVIISGPVYGKLPWSNVPSDAALFVAAILIGRWTRRAFDKHTIHTQPNKE